MFVLCRFIEYHHAAAAMCQCFHICQACPRGPYSRLWQVAAGRPFLFFLYVLPVDSSVCNTMAVAANMFMRYSLHFTDAKLSSRYYNIVVFLLHNDDIYVWVQMICQSPRRALLSLRRLVCQLCSRTVTVASCPCGMVLLAVRACSICVPEPSCGSCI